MEDTAKEDTDMDMIITEVDPTMETGEDMISTTTTMEDTVVTVGHISIITKDSVAQMYSVRILFPPILIVDLFFYYCFEFEN